MQAPPPAPPAQVQQAPSPGAPTPVQQAPRLDAPITVQQAPRLDAPIPVQQAPRLDAPTPVQQAPVGRPVAFPGHNGHPLAGTVLEGPGSWFVVLVADAGPMDRDWATSRLPHSHPGRDFADWLRAQGLGSLRYDKRFLGSRDPRLDVSLDAQAGDIRAALKAARGLKEAKGRKILLAGLGEGALLSLLATTEADAVLLVGLPPRTLAQSIQDQVKAAVPPGLQGVCDTRLQEVFTAIRQGSPLPPPGPYVPPALESMGRGLMAPETLAFVKATLDLDPWPMVGRLSIPAALLRGLKDPAAGPPPREGLPVTILDIPDANHVLKLEERPLEQLDGAALLASYGDGTPMADLSPLAEWLRKLP
jgi:hypothetical protein